jgi:MFS family permease
MEPSEKMGVLSGSVPQFAGICVAHWLSHVYLLALPILFPYLRDALSVSYLELGLAVTIFSCVSATTQTPIGFLVDRIGPTRVLLAGAVLGGLSLIFLSQALSYQALLLTAAVLGLANSVYHPANYAILSASIQERWMGRAFSIHTFAGHVGTALAPVLVALLSDNFGGRGAILGIGLLGPIVGLALMISPGTVDVKAASSKRNSNGVRALLSVPRLWMLTGFFLLLSFPLVGISNFAIVAFESGYAMSVSTATLALSVYLGASAAGVLAGGLLADRIERHGAMVAICFGINAVLIGAVAALSLRTSALIALMALAGFLGGLIAPSRDMLVRKSAPHGATGRAFGLVTTGFSLGGIVGPLVFGRIMDLQLPRMVFAVAALTMLASLVLSLAADREPVQIEHHRG